MRNPDFRRFSGTVQDWLAEQDLAVADKQNRMAEGADYGTGPSHLEFRFRPSKAGNADRIFLRTWIKNTVTGEEIEITDYEKSDWKWFG